MADEHPVVIQNQPSGVFETANRVVGAFAGAPMLLLMVILNLGFIGAAAYYLRNQQDQLTKMVSVIMDRCLPDVHGDAYIVPPGGQTVVPYTPPVQHPNNSESNNPLK
jgi:hypothetical protein